MVTCAQLGCSGEESPQGGETDTSPTAMSATGSSVGGASSSSLGGLSASSMGNPATTAGGGLSYARDVAPIFEARCTNCHHTGVSAIPDIENPFDPQYGLVGFANTWVESFPDTPALNVAPGNPDQSFLIDKVTDPAIRAGDFMPWAPARLSGEELAALRQWISDGAQNDAFFAASVQPIFGTPGALGAPGGKCNYCHYAGGNPPNLEDPFDPDTGVVNVPAIIGTRIRVVPGDPDSSFLMIKVEASEPSREIGDPMPLAYPSLSQAQVDIVRQWIAEGALDN